MRAIGLIEFGGPEVLKVVEIPSPSQARASCGSESRLSA